MYKSITFLEAKGLVTELAPPHVQSAWGSREERIRVVGLAACCNYFSKKKKKTFLEQFHNKSQMINYYWF